MATHDNVKPEMGAEMIENISEKRQMTEALPEEHPWAVIKKNPKLILYAIIANIGPPMFGYDFVIVAAIAVLHPFQ